MSKKMPFIFYPTKKQKIWLLAKKEEKGFSMSFIICQLIDAEMEREQSHSIWQKKPNSKNQSTID